MIMIYFSNVPKYIKDGISLNFYRKHKYPGERSAWYVESSKFRAAGGSCFLVERRVRARFALWRTSIIAWARRACIRSNKVSAVIMTGSLPARRNGIWSVNEWTRRTKGWLVPSCNFHSPVNKPRTQQLALPVQFSVPLFVLTF